MMSFRFFIILVRYVFVIHFVLISSLAPSMAWEAPLGIPDPEFGIAETAPTRPSSWTVEIPGFYYIDQHHSQASNTANTYGTPEKPRSTIPGSLPAGAVVEVHGIYDYAPTGYSVVSGDGTPGKPIFIRGVAGDERPQFQRKIVPDGSYQIYENIDFDGGSFVVGTSRSVHHVAVRNCEFHNHGARIGIGGSQESPNHNIVIYNNKMHDNHDSWDDPDGGDIDWHAIKPAKYVRDIWIIDNTFYHVAGSALQVGDWPGEDPLANSYVNRIFIGRNTAFNNRQSSLGLKACSDVVLSENVSYSNRRIQSGNVSAGIVYQYGPENVWIIFNRIYDSDFGIKTGSNSGGLGQHQYIVGNSIYNIHYPGEYNPASAWSPAAIMLAGGRQKYVVGNTMYDVDAGINDPSGGAALTIENNIVAQVARANHVFVEHGSTADQSTLRNNLFYQDQGSIQIRWGSSSVYDVAGFQNAFPGQCAGCLAADPQFVDSASSNFNLKEDSPAVDTGVLSTVYEAYSNTFNLNISKDLAGRVRPQDGKWDIGAFEFGIGADSGIPGAPKNLRIND
jgi:hypothetical protein